MVVLVTGHSVSGSSFTINHSCDKRGGPAHYTRGGPSTLYKRGGQYIIQLWIKTIQVEYMAENNSKLK
jgi:hypothetical protein